MTRATYMNGMTYQGWQVRGQWFTSPFRVPYSGAGGAQNARRAVTGGRWKIRRRPDGPINKPWFAWTEGKAKKWNRRFETHAEAVHWAHYVAEMYRMFDRGTADATIGLFLRYPKELDVA